jgi:hypothetical protein
MSVMIIGPVTAGGGFFQEFETCVHYRLAAIQIRQNASEAVFDTMFHVTIFKSDTDRHHHDKEHSNLGLLPVN